MSHKKALIFSYLVYHLNICDASSLGLSGLDERRKIFAVFLFTGLQLNRTVQKSYVLFYYVRSLIFR